MSAAIILVPVMTAVPWSAIGAAIIGAAANLGYTVADSATKQSQSQSKSALTLEKAGANPTEAKAEVPRAMAQALREGKLGAMDYYRMQNIKADTQMRDTIGGQPQQSGSDSK